MNTRSIVTTPASRSKSRRSSASHSSGRSPVLAETRERGCVPIVALRKGRPIPLTAIPHGSPEWKRLYHRRVAVEREFGRLKHEFALAPLRVRGLARVQLHADLCILARLALALERARAVPLAA